MGTPSLESQQNAVVTLTVVRNDAPPIFTQDPYTKTIQEDIPAGQSVIDVLANDADTVVSEV